MTTCYVLDHIMRQIPHLGIGSYILIDVELILLVPRGVRLNPAGGVDHMAGGFLDTRVRSSTHRRQDGRPQGHALRTPVEQVLGRDAFLASRLNFNATEPIPEPFDDGAGGSLGTFYRVLAGQHGVGEGAKEPGTVDGLCGLPENDMRGSGDEGDLARL